MKIHDQEFKWELSQWRISIAKLFQWKIPMAKYFNGKIIYGEISMVKLLNDKRILNGKKNSQ